MLEANKEFNISHLQRNKPRTVDDIHNVGDVFFWKSTKKHQNCYICTSIEHPSLPAIITPQQILTQQFDETFSDPRQQPV